MFTARYGRVRSECRLEMTPPRRAWSRAVVRVRARGHSSRMTPPIALTIAGSDSGGGAGIQADLKTFQHFRVFGTSVITAITAQNTRGVARWIRGAGGDDRGADRGRCGRPATRRVENRNARDATIVNAVAAAVRRHALAPLVVDPVMVSASGDALLEGDAVAAMRKLLIPLADSRHAESRRGRDSRGRDDTRCGGDGARGADARRAGGHAQR